MPGSRSCPPISPTSTPPPPPPTRSPPTPAPTAPPPPAHPPPPPPRRLPAPPLRPPPAAPAGGASRCPLCPVWLSTLVSPGILCRLTRRARGRAQGVRGPRNGGGSRVAGGGSRKGMRGKLWLGVAVSVALLWVAFRGVDAGEIVQKLRQVRTVWLLPVI